MKLRQQQKDAIDCGRTKIFADSALLRVKQLTNTNVLYHAHEGASVCRVGFVDIFKIN